MGRTVITRPERTVSERKENVENFAVSCKFFIQADHMKLDDYRKDIDRIDKQLVELLESRIDVAEKIGIHKMKTGKAVLDASREQAKIESLEELCRPATKEYISDIMKGVIKACRQYQEDHIREYGLLGRSLKHSFSPQVHKAIGGYDYGIFEVEPDELEKFLTKAAFKGINVTIPYKKDVIRYCSDLSDVARETNSVNTIVKDKQGRLFGDNTDYYGFCYLLESAGIDVRGAKTLVLGNGGVAGTVRKALKDRGALPVVTISRRSERDNYNNIAKHYDAQIIVNTTPVGMYPNNGECPVDLEKFTRCEAVVDMIYNPIKTKLILDAERIGIQAAGGFMMLIAQAAGACERFTGKKTPEKVIDEVYRGVLRDSENIVLIGMPGCGKSAIGRRLAKITGKTFKDTDRLIREKTGKTPEEIIRGQNEEYFRSIETEVLEEATKEGGSIISCGGGIVVKERNRDLLRQNGRVVYIRRDLDLLTSKGRPLSQEIGVEELFNRRKSAYEGWCDISAENRTIPGTAYYIARRLGYETEK